MRIDISQSGDGRTEKGVGVASQKLERIPGFEKLLSGAASRTERNALKECAFQRMISVERKRTERSKEPFLLMLFETARSENGNKHASVLDRIAVALSFATRETDVIGWYKDVATVGVIFTGLGDSDKSLILTTILNRVRTTLSDELPLEECRDVRISFHFFPDEWKPDTGGHPCNVALYPDLQNADKTKRSVLFLKRVIDVFGSCLLLTLCAPLFAAIALAIKMSSAGPVFFKQERLGQNGRRFTFFKFRSMYVNNDESEHKEYMKKLIAGSAERLQLKEGAVGVFKLAKDNRITPIGKLLRRTSLDEMPQFVNVLRGEMSLVGPRPPIPYELAAYEVWHRRRLLQVKPGITGLWQVTGRNRVPFDEMVRLDLHYATRWTPWLDLKILLKTPGAVVKGAY